MPDYKKKNLKRAGVKRSRTARAEEIPMSPKSTGPAPAKKKGESKKQTKGSLRVVRGNKLRNRRKAQIISGILLTVVALVLILHFSFPTGLFDQIKVWSSSVGGSQFPVSMAGGNTLTVDKKGSLYYTLSDTMLEGYNGGGKRILKAQHGFSAPVMRSSATRTLVFDQGGSGYKLYSAEGVLLEKTTENGIISGNVSRCGTFVIATKAQGYASSVFVYGKNGEQLYQWNSSVELVSDVALSDNGKKLAVAVFNSNNGEYTSKVYVLTFDSANPVHTQEYKGEFVYSLQTNLKKGFVAVHTKGATYTSWGKYVKQSFTTENQLRMYRGNSKFSLIVTTRSSDKKDNTFTLFNKKGNEISQIKWEHSITDAALIGNHILVLSDTELFLLDKSGKIVRKGDAGFGGVRVVGHSLENATVISDNLLNKVVLKSEK